MEMRLRENPLRFSSALLQLSARYLFVQGVQVRLLEMHLEMHLQQTDLCLYVFVCVCVHAGLFFSVCSSYPQETPHGLESLCTKVSLWFGFHGDRVLYLPPSCAAGMLSNGAFPGRLLFEASGFLVSSGSLLLGVTLVLRVDAAVTRWFNRLVPDPSR